jgi:SAM-dependent methyltransferase
MVTGFLPDLPMPDSAPCLCDFCGQDSLSFVYAPERSTRGLTVHLCGHCGLVQSLPRIDRTAARHEAAVSGGADWGNVRYGKGFRTRQAMDALAPYANFEEKLAVLDVGSNRGRFAEAILNAAPNARLVAVEPDERYAQLCGSLPRTELIQARIEKTALAGAGFDIVHSCHTIEHLAAPFAALQDHARVLKDGGLLVIDAPNTALLGSDDILEEWFIDKHLYHFSARTLTRMIAAAGFTILTPPDDKDAINLLIVARKNGAVPQTQIAADPAEVLSAQSLMKRYAVTRAQNCAALDRAAREISGLKPRRIAVWGAGRLFDALVLTGGLDPKMLTLLIDAHLIAHMPDRHGMTLSPPEALKNTPVDVIVVMSRGFAGEIVEQARARAPHAEVILYADLLARARHARAA